MVSRQGILNAIRSAVPVRKYFSGVRSCCTRCRCPLQLHVHHDKEPGEPSPEESPLHPNHDLRRDHCRSETAYFLSFFAPPLVLAVPRNSFILFLRCLPVQSSACVRHHTIHTRCQILNSTCVGENNVRCCLEAFSTLVAMPYLTSL